MFSPDQRCIVVRNLGKSIDLKKQIRFRAPIGAAEDLNFWPTDLESDGCFATQSCHVACDYSAFDS